ncbi:AMP-binding protein [Alicyclobacillus tolerans]|uniref:AMP-binding protein n=1 Tax=Alicyclobacillus tolerans TaxID=90970 RepID=UPI001F25F2A0|nr:AMP-binding protein [Alicyclobacillus tolerans]MCF8565747.1 AMP-binding protein [Alicyclobacillus tolerans]
MPSEKTFYSAFADSIDSYLERTAVIDSHYDETLSYGDLLLNSRRLAQGFYNIGLRAGDIIAVWLPNGIPSLVIQLSASLMGLGLVGVNTRYATSEVLSALALSHAKVVIYDSAFMNGRLQQTYQDVLPQLNYYPLLVDVAVSNSPASIKYKELVEYSYDKGKAEMSTTTPLNMFVTSGTTSQPKLVVHSQVSVTSRCQYVARCLEWGPGRTLLGVLPLCGVFGFNSAWGMLFAGGTVATTKMFNVNDALASIERDRVTDLVGSDTMFFRMVEAEGAASVLPRIQLGIFANYTGRSRELIALYDKLGVPLAQPYGSSEVQALMSTWKSTDPIELRSNGGGRLLSPHIAVRVVDVTTRQVMPFGETGEIEISGVEVFTGYLNNPAKTQAVMTEDGWFKTGDVGYVREDGSFVFLSRLNDALRLGGFLVDPSEIEQELVLISGISEAQVVSASTGTEGDVAIAFVKTEYPLDVEEVRRQLRKRIAGYKVPKHIRIVDEYPMTAAGTNGEKIQKAILRKMAQEVVDHA